MLKGMKIPCIVTGKLSYFSKDALTKKTAKFGSVDDFAAHYICPPARKLLRTGQTVDDVRGSLKVSENLPIVSLDVLARLRLLKTSKKRKSSAEQVERARYLESKEFKDKIRAWRDHNKNMSFQDWVEKGTGIGRERGGTCLRPDIFLAWNDKACDGCNCYEFCLCYSKRLSHEKKRPKKR